MTVGTRTTGAAFVAMLWLTLAGHAFAQDGLKIYISADMEGLTGAVTSEQLGPDGFEYARFRQIMTDEVNGRDRGRPRGGRHRDPGR